MAANKVILNGETLIDLTQDSVTEADVAEGKTFHKADGEQAVGTAVIVGEITLQNKTITENGTYTPDEGYTGFGEVTVNVESEIDDDYNIPTMQKFIDDRGSIAYLYHGANPNDDDIAWLSQIDLSNVTNAEYAFCGCESLKKFPVLDTSKIEDMSNMFYMCERITGDIQLNTSSCTKMNGMFGVTTGHSGKIILSDTSKVTDMSGMFMSPSSNRRIVKNQDVDEGYDVDLDISSCTNIQSMFYGNSVRSVRLRNGKNFTGSTSQFAGNSYAITDAHIEISNPTNVSNMFYYCLNLKNVSGIDLQSATSTSGMFNNCSSLRKVELMNIRTSLQVGKGTSYGHLLTVGSLIGLCYELCDVGSSRTLTVGSANLTKLESVYVKVIDITDEMIAVDGRVSEKLPFEAYVIDPDNSTDIESHVSVTRVASEEDLPEGAVLINTYVGMKKWKLA